jgi:hypothetical protein
MAMNCSDLPELTNIVKQTKKLQKLIDKIAFRYGEGTSTVFVA